MPVEQSYKTGFDLLLLRKRDNLKYSSRSRLQLPCGSMSKEGPGSPLLTQLNSKTDNNYLEGTKSESSPLVLSLSCLNSLPVLEYRTLTSLNNFLLKNAFTS